MDNIPQNPDFSSRYHVLVEGNIAVGKSTFINHLRKQLGENAEILFEPLDKWTNLKGANLLQDMYDNPTQRSFHTQSYIQLTMAINQQTPVHKPIKIMERSLESGRFVFMEAMLKEGHIDQTEYDILDEWFTWLKQKNSAVDEIIYLRSTPAVALQRLLSRNRIEESSVTLSYLSAIHRLYDNWLFNTDIPVTVINQDQTLEETLSAANQLATKFKSKIFPFLLH